MSWDVIVVCLQSQCVYTGIIAKGLHYREQCDVLRGDLKRVSDDLKYETIIRENAVKALQVVEAEKCGVFNEHESLLIRYDNQCKIASGLEEERDTLQGALTAAEGEIEKLKTQLKYQTDRAVDAEGHLASRPTEEAAISKFVKSSTYQELVEAAVAAKVEKIAHDLGKMEFKAKKRKQKIRSLKMKLKKARRGRANDVPVEVVHARDGEGSGLAKVPIAAVPVTAVCSAGTEMAGDVLLTLGAAPALVEGREGVGSFPVAESCGEHVPGTVAEEKLDVPVSVVDEEPDAKDVVEPVAVEDEMDAEVAAVFFF